MMRSRHAHPDLYSKDMATSLEQAHMGATLRASGSRRRPCRGSQALVTSDGKSQQKSIKGGREAAPHQRSRYCSSTSTMSRCVQNTVAPPTAADWAGDQPAQANPRSARCCNLPLQ